MKPILIIGPGTSLLKYTIDPLTGGVLVTCPACGASGTVSKTGRRQVAAMVEHEPGCRWLASLERAAAVDGKDAPNGSIH